MAMSTVSQLLLAPNLMQIAVQHIKIITCWPLPPPPPLSLLPPQATTLSWEELWVWLTCQRKFWKKFSPTRVTRKSDKSVLCVRAWTALARPFWTRPSIGCKRRCWVAFRRSSQRCRAESQHVAIIRSRVSVTFWKLVRCDCSCFKWPLASTLNASTFVSFPERWVILEQGQFRKDFNCFFFRFWMKFFQSFITFAQLPSWNVPTKWPMSCLICPLWQWSTSRIN